VIRSTLTDRGQTTIPAAVRKALGLQPRQQITYEVREDGVLIRAERETLTDLAGSIRSAVPLATKAQERAAARAARGERRGGRR
jgi:AbrB family looped-hinge helix DNA binding protein